MSPVDARGIASIARNPRCHLHAAMIALGIPEHVCYDLVTDQPYLGPHGERTAALRWGTLFDACLTENQAKRLLAAIDGWLGIRAATATVRDLRREVPGTRPAALAERNRLTRAVLADLLAGRAVPDVLIQPPLQLRWGGRNRGFIVPDALVWDREDGMYVPLEAKGFISIDGMVGPGERAALRLQAAVQSHALFAELCRIEPGRAVTPWALVVVATPFGFRPAPAALEHLGAEIAAVETALRTMERTWSDLVAHGQTRTLPEALAHQPIHFQESCLSFCAMAEVCRTRAPGVRGELGDHAATLIGEAIDLARVISLVSGEPPTTPEESALLASLQDTASIFQGGWG